MIFVVTGSPAVGKSTLCKALLQRFEFGLHIPGDDLRQWVVSGIADPVGWTDETTRQFKLAEGAMADVALRYDAAGFAVAIDHCSGPPDLDELVAMRLADREVVKVAVVSDLDTNLHRNRSRDNKDFEHTILTGTIERLSPLFRSSQLEDSGWIVLDNSSLTVEETVNELLRAIGHACPERE